MSISSLCRQQQVSRNTYYSRRRSGWSHEEALGLVERNVCWHTLDQVRVDRVLRAWPRPEVRA